MAIYTGQSPDTIVNGYLFSIRNAEYGSDARVPMANAIKRCYELAKIKVGSVVVPSSSITTKMNYIKSKAYGDDVRDAFVEGIELCYQQRKISVTDAERGYLNDVLNAQLGEDLKNGILKSIVRCCKDVS